NPVATNPLARMYFSFDRIGLKAPRISGLGSLFSFIVPLSPEPFFLPIFASASWGTASVRAANRSTDDRQCLIRSPRFVTVFVEYHEWFLRYDLSRIA
ncbi:MAG TPA: hypothetical protein QGG32_01465, partial [Rhodospirillales bacterium]|nr:hypothetical protein [Rhodospirillales bacterium]